MRELALHILDLMENAVRAGASRVIVSLKEDTQRDRLELCVEDDGPGLSIPKRAALDPFFTTKDGKRVGLGLSLLKAGAERAGGKLVLKKSRLGGLSVRVVMGLNHVDRAPLGNLARTSVAMVCTHPEIDFRFRIGMNGTECEVSSRELAMELSNQTLTANDILALSQRLGERLEEGISTLKVVE